MFTALARAVPADRFLEGPLTQLPTAEQKAALARGSSLFLHGAPSTLSTGGLPSPPGTDWTWGLADRDRVEMKLALARHERGVRFGSTARMWFADPTQSYPLCARGSNRSILDKPEGAQVAELRACVLSLGETAPLTTYAIKGQRGEWLQLDGGWVREREVAAASMLVHEQWVVPLPLHAARKVRWEKGELTLEGDPRLCLRQHCTVERSEDGEPGKPPEPPPEEPWQRETVPVPECEHARSESCHSGGSFDSDGLTIHQEPGPIQ